MDLYTMELLKCEPEVVVKLEPVFTENSYNVITVKNDNFGNGNTECEPVSFSSSYCRSLNDDVIKQECKCSFCMKNQVAAFLPTANISTSVNQAVKEEAPLAASEHRQENTDNLILTSSCTNDNLRIDTTTQNEEIKVKDFDGSNFDVEPLNSVKVESDEELETDMPKTRAKTPAERAREYRARKKLLKPQKPPAQTAAQRKRAYRDRQQALRNAVATIGDNVTPSTNSSASRELPIVNPDNPQPSTNTDDDHILYNYLSQTSGQAGQAQIPVGKAEDRIIVQADVHQANSSRFTMNPTSTTRRRTRKSCAQRCREYRQRKKAREDADAIVVQRPVVSPVECE